MIISAIALLAVATVASSASIGSPSPAACCGPAEWEAMAVASAAYGYEKASSSMSGRLSVSHAHNIASLVLMSEMMGNMTMVINESQIFFYFVIQQHRQQPEQQPSCAAFVLQNVVADLTSSCFPTDHASPVDRLTTALGSLPINLIAYEYGGLAGLMAIQMFAGGQDCSPLMFSASTPGVSNGPQMSVLLSNIQSSVSDRSVFDQSPAACLGVNPLSINMGNMGRSSRGGPMGSVGPSSGSRGGDQWIEDMVAMYVLQKMQVLPSRNRRDLKDLLGLSQKHGSSSADLKDALGLDNRRGSPDLVDVVESAAAMRLMLQAYRDFVSQLGGDRSSRGPGLLGGDSSRGVLGLLGGDNSRGPSIGSILGGGGSRGPNFGPRGSSDQSDLDTLVSLLVQQNALSGLGRQDQSNADQLAQLALSMQKMQATESLMQLMKRASLYEAKNSNDRGPSVDDLVKLAALSAAKDANQGPDYQTILELMLLQQQQQQQRPGRH